MIIIVMDTYLDVRDTWQPSFQLFQELVLQMVHLPFLQTEINDSWYILLHQFIKPILSFFCF